MRNQHEYVTAIGADSRYSAVQMSPLDKAIRQLQAEGRKILGFDRSLVMNGFEREEAFWIIKVMAP